jgi:hypothetical protein
MRGILPRLNIFRAAVRPRPILPTSRLATSALTNSPRSARLFTHFPARLASDQSSSSQNNSSAGHDTHTTLPPDASLSQRLKHLIKTYGWYALGIYLVIGVLDFGVAFIGINLLGADYVSSIASSAKHMVTDLFNSRPAEPGRDEIDPIGHASPSGQEGLYAMIVLAYTVHKTLFLPVRVGVTAAVTPKIVGWLAKRGWAGGAGTRRAATEMRAKLKERRERKSGES